MGKPFSIKICTALSFSLLTACSGADDDNGPFNFLEVGGLWRGSLAARENNCQLELTPTVEFAHSVSQSLDSIELRERDGRLFVGDLVGDDGFSVDAPGPSNERTGDGRTCSFTYRLRYDSINDDGDRTAQVRYIFLGQCSDGSECQSEYAGDGIRG